MADISMCLNEKCPSRMSCYRFTAPVSSYWQTFADFKPDGDRCEDYIPRNRQKE